MNRPCCVWTYFQFLLFLHQSCPNIQGRRVQNLFRPSFWDNVVFIHVYYTQRPVWNMFALSKFHFNFKKNNELVEKILFRLHHISDSSWKHVLESGSVRVSRHPKSLGGSWAVFNSSKKELEWLIADPHPEFWRDGGGKHVLLHHALPG